MLLYILVRIVSTIVVTIEMCQGALTVCYFMNDCFMFSLAVWYRSAVEYRCTGKVFGGQLGSHNISELTVHKW